MQEEHPERSQLIVQLCQIELASWMLGSQTAGLTSLTSPVRGMAGGTRGRLLCSSFTSHSMRPSSLHSLKSPRPRYLRTTGLLKSTCSREWMTHKVSWV